MKKIDEQLKEYNENLRALLVALEEVDKKNEQLRNELLKIAKMIKLHEERTK